MSAKCIAEQGSSIGNDWAKFAPEVWNWAKGNGCYDNGQDFFSVHWEVRMERHTEEYDGSVRLHVESPRYADDTALNDIKRDVIADLHAANAEALALQEGYGYRLGQRSALSPIREHKSTEAFRILVPSHRRGASHVDDMKSVHAVFGAVVEAVLSKYAERLRLHFGHTDK